MLPSRSGRGCGSPQLEALTKSEMRAAVRNGEVQRDSSVCRTWVIRSEVLSKVAVKSNPGIIDMVEG